MIVRSIAWRVVLLVAYVVTELLAEDSSCGAAGIVKNLHLNFADRIISDCMPYGHDIVAISWIYALVSIISAVRVFGHWAYWNRIVHPPST